MTDYPLNVLLVNQNDNNEMVSDVEDGNYVFINTRIHGRKFLRVRITVEVTHEDDSIETYWTTLDSIMKVIEENSIRENP